MAEFPALPLWTDAYLGDTTHLTTIEHGAYLLLLLAMWRTRDCSLPNDDKLLARYTRLTAGQWARVKPVLMPFFDVLPDRITQGRLTDEHNLVRQNSRKASDSAKARWLKNKESGDADALQSDSERNAPTPTPTPKEEEEANASSKTAKAKRGSRLPRDAILPDAFRAFALQEGHPDPDREWAQFVDYWSDVPGAKGCKLDWLGTWRNRIRKVMEDGKRPGNRSGGGGGRSGGDAHASLFAAGARIATGGAQGGR